MRFRTIAIGASAIVAPPQIIMTGALMPVLGVVLRRNKAEVEDEENA